MDTRDQLFCDGSDQHFSYLTLDYMAGRDRPRAIARRQVRQPPALLGKAIIYRKALFVT